MKLAIGCDHVAVELKNLVIKHLEASGHTLTDVGTNDDTRCNYPDYALKVATLVKNKEVDEGVLICGTGVGMSIAANKVNGIRAVVCSEPFSARASKQHNDANIVCFGARVVGSSTAFDIVDAFFNASYEAGRHQQRIDIINKIELHEK